MIEKGQFWKKTNDSKWVVEIFDILHKGDSRVETLCKFWYPTGQGRYYMVGPARRLVVFSFDFCNWKLVDIECIK